MPVSEADYFHGLQGSESRTAATSVATAAAASVTAAAGKPWGCMANNPAGTKLGAASLGDSVPAQVQPPAQPSRAKTLAPRRPVAAAGSAAA